MDLIGLWKWLLIDLTTQLYHRKIKNINKWLDVHPSKDDPNAPLWVNLRGPARGLAMQYKTIRLTLAEISERGGVKKKVFYHLFRHQKITEMILQGYSEQQIKF
jgi:site-specific recombinase XerD